MHEGDIRSTIHVCPCSIPTFPTLPMAIFRRSDFTFSTPFWTEENSSQSSLPGRRIVSSLLGMGNVSSSLSRYHWVMHGEVLIKYETPSPPQTLTQNSPLLNEKKKKNSAQSVWEMRNDGAKVCLCCKINVCRKILFMNFNMNPC